MIVGIIGNYEMVSFKLFLMSHKNQEISGF